MEGGTNIAYTRRDETTSIGSTVSLRRERQAEPAFRVLVQAQDARVEAKDVGSTTAAVQEPVRPAAAYGDIGNTQEAALTLRVGRQEMFYGEQRLIGHLTWVNAARSFDGVRATYKTVGSSSTGSPPRSCESSTASSTRAATAIVSWARTVRDELDPQSDRRALRLLAARSGAERRRR